MRCQLASRIGRIAARHAISCNRAQAVAQRGKGARMLTSRIATVCSIGLVAVASLTALAQDESVDRDQLRRLVRFPNVVHLGWYYELGMDGVVRAGGYDDLRYDVTILRNAADADAANAKRWADLATGYRRADDDEHEKESLARAVALLRKQVGEDTDDGQALASLGLALVATGDDAGGAAVIRKAQAAARNAWAGDVAAGDVAALGAFGQLAEQRFATLEEAIEWLGRNADHASDIDAILLDAAVEQYSAAVAGVADARAAGAGAAVAYMRRASASRIREVHDPSGASTASRSDADDEKALELIAAAPYAATLLALRAAMRPDPAAGGRERAFEFSTLTETAQANVKAGVTRLRRMVGSSGTDARRAARALQGVACVQWFVYQDAPAAEATLRRSIAKDSGVRHSWDVLAMVLASSGRWEEVISLGNEWLEHDDAPHKRMLIATAYAFRKQADEAEGAWRAALALDPNGMQTNLGVAALVLRRSEDEATAKEALPMVQTAKATLAAAEGASARQHQLLCEFIESIALGLSGDIDGAEKVARNILETVGDVPEAREILKALGR